MAAITIEKTTNGNIYVVLVERDEVQIIHEDGHLNHDQKWGRLLEHVEGWLYIPAGTYALTSAPVLQEESTDLCYWYPGYETTDELEVLLRDGRVYFPAAPDPVD